MIIEMLNARQHGVPPLRLSPTFHRILLRKFDISLKGHIEFFTILGSNELWRERSLAFRINSRPKIIGFALDISYYTYVINRRNNGVESR